MAPVVCEIGYFMTDGDVAGLRRATRDLPLTKMKLESVLSELAATKEALRLISSRPYSGDGDYHALQLIARTALGER